MRIIKLTNAFQFLGMEINERKANNVLGKTNKKEWEWTRNLKISTSDNTHVWISCPKRRMQTYIDRSRNMKGARTLFSYLFSKNAKIVLKIQQTFTASVTIHSSYIHLIYASNQVFGGCKNEIILAWFSQRATYRRVSAITENFRPELTNIIFNRTRHPFVQCSRYQNRLKSRFFHLGNQN